MSKLTEQIAIIVGEQSAEGTINATIRDATAVSATTGILIRKDSLNLELERLEEPGEEIAGTFTKTPGDFLLAQAAEFSFDVTLRGAGTALVPGDGDHDIPAPILDLFEGAGVVDVSSTADITNYGLAAPKFLTIKVWRGGQAFVFQDCHTNLSLKLTPKEVGVLTVTVLSGAVTHRDSDTFPSSIAYGKQETTSAPVLKSAGAQIGSVVRGFIEGTLEITPEYEEFPDSNAALGASNEMTGRGITFKGQFFVDSTDHDQDWQNLIRSSSFEDFSFRLGAVDGNPSNSLRFVLKRVDLQKMAHVGEVGRQVFELDVYATGAVAGSGYDEFTMHSE